MVKTYTVTHSKAFRQALSQDGNLCPSLLRYAGALTPLVYEMGALCVVPAHNIPITSGPRVMYVHEHYLHPTSVQLAALYQAFKVSTKLKTTIFVTGSGPGLIVEIGLYKQGAHEPHFCLKAGVAPDGVVSFKRVERFSSIGKGTPATA